mmetsp:Transcript_20627/g.57538  ORF Transcript_20627/g.57538 Transcript_20627/m.57538 type:complete len:206 (+) Transcript_20627:500-1117(+)
MQASRPRHPESPDHLRKPFPETQRSTICETGPAAPPRSQLRPERNRVPTRFSPTPPPSAPAFSATGGLAPWPCRAAWRPDPNAPRPRQAPAAAPSPRLPAAAPPPRLGAAAARRSSRRWPPRARSASSRTRRTPWRARPGAARVPLGRRTPHPGSTHTAAAHPPNACLPASPGLGRCRWNGTTSSSWPRHGRALRRRPRSSRPTD